MLKGQKMSELAKRKISNTLKGRPKSKQIKDKLSESLMGHKISKETREKISKKLKGRKLSERCRINLSLALGGDGDIKRINSLKLNKSYINWRKNVLKRDNYECQLCHVIGGKLIAHHILPYAKFKKSRTKISNGITLCKECHDDIKGKEENYEIIFRCILETYYYGEKVQKTAMYG